MVSGRQQLRDVANDMKFLADSNPCGMSDATMGIVARAMRALIGNAVATELSSDCAAAYLGISVRTLGRLVQAGEIEPPRRKGFRRKAYNRANLDQYILKKQK